MHVYIYMDIYMYIYMYIYVCGLQLYIYIYILVKAFVNAPGHWGSIPSRVMTKTQKIVLESSLQNIQHYKVRIKGKVVQSRERGCALLNMSVEQLLCRLRLRSANVLSYFYMTTTSVDVRWLPCYRHEKWGLGTKFKFWKMLIVFHQGKA